MKKFILLIFFSVLILGCNNSLEDSSNELVARAGENFLYKNQLPSFKSEEDSLKRFLNFVEDWAKQRIFYDLSLTNLSQTKKDELDDLVENFKSDLYINAYKDLIINSRIDSIVSNQEIESFYNENINAYRLNENLLKYRYVKLPEDNINRNQIRKYISRMNSNDRLFLDSLNFQFADLKLNDSIWFTEREVISSVEFLNQRNKIDYQRVNRLYEINENDYVSYFIVIEYLNSGNIPPLSYLYDRIRLNIINQRKINLIQQINKEILNDALKSNKYETFN